MPSLRPRITPSFVVAVLALCLASGGVGYAAAQITSADIRDNTIQSRDVKDETLAGGDIRDGSIPRRKIDDRCPTGHSALFGGCVPRASSNGNSSYQAAIDDCNRRNGRLPTTAELFWIASHVEFEWADGNPSQYEFTGDYTDGAVYTPIAFDRATNDISNASGQMFWHHCVISY